MPLDEKLHRTAVLIALLVMALAFTGIATASLGIDPLRAVRLEAAPMEANTALCLLLAAAALWVQLRPNFRWTGIACATVASALAGAAVVQNLLHLEAQIDEFIPRLLGRLIPGHPPGRMTTPTALAIIACATAIGTLRWPRSWFRAPFAAWFAHGVIALGVAVLLGHALGAITVFPLPFQIGTQPAAALLALGVGVVLARSDSRLVQLFFSAEALGVLVRRLYFGVAALPLCLALALGGLARFGWLEPVDVVVVFWLAWFLSIFALVLFSINIALNLNDEREQAEQARLRLMARLEEQAARLQEIVSQRTSELDEANVNLRASAETSARLALVAQYTTNGVTIADADGRVQWINAAFERLTGYTLDEMRGQKPGHMLQGADTDPADADRLRQARQEGAACQVEILNYTKQGRAFWALINLQPVRDHAGQLVNFIAIHTDVTEQHAATTRLHELNERLQLATRSAALGVWEWDAVARKSVWDDRTLEIYGLRRDEHTGTFSDWLDGIHPEDRARARAQFEAVDRGADSYELDYRIVRANDGAVRHLQARAIVQRDPEGRLLRMTGTERDVTAEHEAMLRSEALNERLRLALRSSKFGVWELDAEDNRLLWDDRMFEIYGMRREDFDGSRDVWRSCVHPEDFDRLQELTRRVLAGEQPTYDTEFRATWPDGTMRYIEAHAYLQRNAEGRAVRFVGLNRDVTAEKQMDEALALVEQRLQLAIEGSNDAVWDWNLETGVLFHDDRWARMLGYEPDEIKHTNDGWKQLVHPEDLAANEHVLQEHFALRTPFYEHELRMRAKNGEWKWILDRGKVVRRAPDGRPLRMAGTHSDVTARRLLENRLHRAEELSEQVSRLALLGGWEYDIETAQLTWSSGLRRIYEVDESFKPTTAYSFASYPPEARETLRAAMDSARLHGSLIDLELPLTTARGRAIWVRVLGKAELANGKPIRLHGAMQDISQQRESENARRGLELQLFQAQKMETLGTLAGGIAHDFNNLLTGIIGYHELAADSVPEDNPARAALAEARNASLRARELVEQILTFGRHSTGVEHGPLDLTLVLEEARRFLRATLPATIAIELNTAPDCSHVLGDATQLHQVLLNLGSNAAHAMRQRGGTLKISLRPAPAEPEPGTPLAGLPPGAYVCIAVSDTGHGMDEETRRRILDPFFTTKNTREGTGLGLAVVHGIIRSHRGTITVDSTPDVGTTFTIFLPAAAAEGAELDPGHAATPRGTGELVCIVDDEEIVGNCTKLVLESKGYQTILFKSAEHCLSELTAHMDGCSLLLTDQMMPGMQGTELAAALRRRRAELPVVIMSGYFSKISATTLDELGQIELLAKPFTTDELALAVHRALHPGKA